MKTIIDTKVIERAIEALEIGQGAFSQCFGGYGFYRPDNPHNFFPDPESCTPEEIANHSAACEAYDKGTYVPDHSDGWITPDLHVTAAPWGIGTYTSECQGIEQSIANLRAALEAKEPSDEKMREGYILVPKNVIDAAKNLVAVKGRYHTEQAYKQLANTLEGIKE